METLKTFTANIFTKPYTKIKEFCQHKKPFLNKNKFQIILCSLICIGIFFIVFYFSLPTARSLGEEIKDKESPFNIRNIAIALAAIATAVFTWWKNSLNYKATETEESTRQDSLFAQAVGFLNEKNDLTTRKGGVHILKDLAMTSPKHAQKCIDMLCSLNESWMPKFLKDYPDFFLINKDFPNIKNLSQLKIKIGSEEISIYDSVDYKSYIGQIALSQLVLLSMSEIIRYINDNNEYKGPYDLQHKYLCSISLSDICFKEDKFTFSHINLNSAMLIYIDLLNTDLRYANFEHALLSKSNFQNSILYYSDFHFATMDDVDLQNTHLEYANLSNISAHTLKLKRANLHYTDLQYAYLREADLQDAVLHYAKLKGANLQGVNLQEANIQYTNMQDIDLRNANLMLTILHSVDLQNANLQNTNLQSAKFRTSLLNKVNLQDANLMYAVLKDVDLRYADLQRSVLKNSFLQDSSLQEANLQQSDLTSANLQGSFLRKANLQSTILQNTILGSTDLNNTNLQNANLKNASLISANLQKANLREANLQGANLQNANLRDGDLWGSDLQATNLQQTFLQYSDLRYTVLNGAIICNADLQGAKLQGANLSGANFIKSILSQTDFRNAINIDKAIFDDNKKDAIFTDEDYKKYYPNP